MSHTRAVDLQPSADVDSDGASDTTLDELQSPYFLGEPLTRMVKVEYLDTPSEASDLGMFDREIETWDRNEIPAGNLVRDEEINHLEDDEFCVDLQLTGDGRQGSEREAPLCMLNADYVRSVIDYMAANPPTLPSPKISLHSTPAHPSHPLLVRRIHSTSQSARELALWRFLNSTVVRRDPWNPSPPALIFERELFTTPDAWFWSGVECSEIETYIVMDQLRSLNENPLKNPDDVIDFNRQILQGLIFLHEHNITQASYSLSDASGFEPIMMDIGLAPPHTTFSRYDFPVKYYVLDFTKAIRLQVHSPVSSPICTAKAGDQRQRIVKPTALNSRIFPHGPARDACSLITDSPVKVILTVPASPSASTCSGSGMLPGSSTPPDYTFDLETPRQAHFLVHSNPPQELSDPEDAYDTSERDEEDGVRTVCPATRDTLFANDINNVAILMEEVTEVATSVREALIPLIAAMRQAKALSLSAEDSLRMFESAVQPLIGPSRE